MDLRETYLHIADSTVESFPVERFWERLFAGELPRIAAGGWLVGRFPYDATWTQEEVHPEGDEIVLLLSGEVDFVLDGGAPVRLRAGSTLVVPRGRWHRAIVHQPGEALHITFGRGTEHRPV
jgi:mannose-6-phosphate isomerase-like protein (cupin superfamily)